MKTKRKSFLGICFAILLIAVWLFGIFPRSSVSVGVSAKAEAATVSASTTAPMSDANYEFKAGAAVEREDVEKLGFGVTVKSDSVRVLNGDYRVRYYFDMYRRNPLDDSETLVAQYLIFRSNKDYGHAYKTLSHYDSDAIGFSPEQKRGTPISLTSEKGAWYVNAYKQEGYIVDYMETFPMGSDEFELTNQDDIKLYINPNSPMVEYFVRFSYKIERLASSTDWGVGGVSKKYEVVSEGKIQSSTRSVYQVLKGMNDAGRVEVDLEGYPEGIERAYEILSADETQSVTVKYLERIGETPFAERITRQIEIPVVRDDPLGVDAVAGLVGLKTFDVIGTFCDEFRFDDSENAYVAHYWDSAVWFSAKTQDGNSIDFYLNCNNTFKESFYHLIEKGFITEGDYEFILQEPLTKYPELQNIAGGNEGNFYGFFAFTVIPTTYTVDDGLTKVVTKAFTGDRTTISEGVAVMTMRNLNLDWAVYYDLLKAANYSYLGKWWNVGIGNLAGDHPATAYFMYAEPEIKEAFVGENGADDVLDDDGYYDNMVEDGKDIVKDNVDSALGGGGAGGAGGCAVGSALGVLLLLLLILLVVSLVKQIVRVFKGENSHTTNIHLSTGRVGTASSSSRKPKKKSKSKGSKGK